MILSLSIKSVKESIHWLNRAIGTWTTLRWSLPNGTRQSLLVRRAAETMQVRGKSDITNSNTTEMNKSIKSCAVRLQDGRRDANNKFHNNPRARRVNTSADN